MSSTRYTTRLTFDEIIALFDKGIYIADLDHGEVLNGKTGKPLFKFHGSRDSDHWWTRLYRSPKYTALPVAHIIWMVGNRIAVPAGFEVHHDNLICTDNRYDNLYALYVLDHRKIHKVHRNGDVQEEIPF